MINDVLVQGLLMNLTNEQKLLFSQAYPKVKRSTGIAYLLLFLLGPFGLQKFYLKNKYAWVYPTFCWTMIIPFCLWIFDLFTLGRQTNEYNLAKATELIAVISGKQQNTTLDALIRSNGMFSDFDLKNKKVISGIAGVIMLFVVLVNSSDKKNSTTTDHNTKAKTSIANTSSTNNDASAQDSDQNSVQDSSSNSQDQEQSQATKPSEPELTIDAMTLNNEFTQNEARANQRYANKIIKITGVIDEVHKEYDGNYSVKLISSQDSDVVLSDVVCEVEPSNPVLQALSKGQSVALVGELDGNGITGTDLNLKDGCDVVR